MKVYVVSYQDRNFSGVSYVADDRKMAQDYIDRQTDKDIYDYRITEIVVSQKDNRKPAEGVRCPHCGSSAQVRSTGAPTLSDNEEVLYEHFTCGCGCHFTAEYVRNDEGAWEWYWTQLNFVDKEMIKKFQKKS